MIRFYAPEINNDSTLPEVESNHCCRVLRMKKDDAIEVVDGKGYLYRCIIREANPKHTTVEIIDKTKISLSWSPRITLAVAPTKNMERIEWLAEKAVEIGVNKLVFLNCHHSVRRTVKRDRIFKILISAMKQSLKAELPELIELIEFKDFISSDCSSQKYIGYCDDQTERKEFSQEYDGVSDLTILIGPEGDFSKDEIKLAVEKEYIPVTFGNTRLRTETAALFGLCATHALINKERK